LTDEHEFPENVKRAMEMVLRDELKREGIHNRSSKYSHMGRIWSGIRSGNMEDRVRSPLVSNEEGIQMRRF
jgi:hypothetical protein